jgi:chitodextrinase
LKKALALLLMITLACSFGQVGVISAADMTLNAGINRANDEVTIQGQASNGPGNAVTVEVRNPNGLIDYIDRVTTGDGGSFQFKYKLKNKVLGTYSVRASAAGIDGQTTTSFTIGPIDETPAGDTTPPAWINGVVKASRVTSSGLTLSWSTASDNVAVTGYKIYRSGENEPIASTNADTLTVMITGLTESKEYTFKVEAEDAKGNHSVDGPSIRVSTAAEIKSSTITIQDGNNKKLEVTENTTALGTPINVSVSSEVSDAVITVAALLTPPADGLVSTKTLPGLTISAILNEISTIQPVKLEMPGGMKLSTSASHDWDGTIHIPTIKPIESVTVDADTGKTATVSAVIEIGFDDVPLTLSNAARILVPGQAGKFAGYYRGTTFTKITTQLSSDDQLTADSQIPDGGDAYIYSGNDLVIWTKHFTKYVIYTQTENSGSDGGGGSSDDSGSGNGSTPVIDPKPPVAEPVTPEEAKSDIKLIDIDGHWAAKDIADLIITGAIEGYPDRTFKPDHNITRAEFVKLLVSALKLPVKTGKVFADTDSHWAKEYIAAAHANGIAGGYTETTFGPDDLITREQMAVMVINAAKLDVVTDNLSFTDEASISDWARSAVATAKEYGIIEGYPDQSFKPSANATRAEASKVIVKGLEHIYKK